MPIQVQGCTVADADDMAINNMAAFFTDTTWVLNWEGKSLETVTANAKMRAPWNLLKNRDTERHIKAIDPDTGRLLGYAKWTLPERCKGEWLGAQVPDVSKEDKLRYLETYGAADWVTRSVSSPLGASKGLRRGVTADFQVP